MHNNLNHQLGLVLRKVRESRKYTQEDFALYCGISRAYYGRIERGEYCVTVEMCYRITDSIGISLSDLFEDIT